MSIFMNQIHEILINKSEIIKSFETIHSIPIIEILQNNVPLFLLAVYFVCYTKAYLSVNHFNVFIKNNNCF